MFSPTYNEGLFTNIFFVLLHLLSSAYLALSKFVDIYFFSREKALSRNSFVEIVLSGFRNGFVILSEVPLKLMTPMISQIQSLNTLPSI